ncbi:MAG: glycosyltransferase [Thermoleophilaceae bacterium]
MRVAIANLSPPVEKSIDYGAYWAGYASPPSEPRLTLFEQPHDWGFHIHSIGVYLLDRGEATKVEFWDYSEQRTGFYLSNGVLHMSFLNDDDVRAYLDRTGDPDIFINHGPGGAGLLEMLAGRCFRVHVVLALPSSRRDAGAECYLVDSEELLDERSLLYVPVVNTAKVAPGRDAPRRDFVYLAAVYAGKRHDLLLDAVRGSELTGHLHPVADPSVLDLRDTRVTTSALNELDVVELLQTSRIAVYPGDQTSNPASMWECVAAGLPIVVNEEIAGGRHLVVPGVTGELAPPGQFREVMEDVLANRGSYRPREHLERSWDTVATIESYLAFFERMGWARHGCS